MQIFLKPHFYIPGMSFSKTWESFIRNLIIKADKACNSFPLRVSRSLSWVDASFQVIKVPPIKKIGDS